MTVYSLPTVGFRYKMRNLDFCNSARRVVMRALFLCAMRCVDTKIRKGFISKKNKKTIVSIPLNYQFSLVQFP